MICDKCTAALPAYQQLVLHQTVEPFAHRSLADAQFATKRDFTWQQGTRFPGPVFDPLKDDSSDLNVKRAALGFGVNCAHDILPI